MESWQNHSKMVQNVNIHDSAGLKLLICVGSRS